MSKKVLIHKGKVEQVIPAVTEQVLVDDPESPDFGTYITRELKPEKRQTITQPVGSRYGEYLIGVPVEVDDPELAKQLMDRGFEEIGAKEAATAPSSPEARNDKAAARDHAEASKKARIFDHVIADPKLASEPSAKKKAAATTEPKAAVDTTTKGEGK